MSVVLVRCALTLASHGSAAGAHLPRCCVADDFPTGFRLATGEMVPFRFRENPHAMPRLVLRNCHCGGFALVFTVGSGRRYLERPVGRLVSGDGLERGPADFQHHADIYNGGTATITTTGEACSSLYIDSATRLGSVQMSGGSLTISDSAFVGYSGVGNFTQSSGVNTISSTMGGLTSATTPAAAGPTASAAPGSCSAAGRSLWVFPAPGTSRSPVAPTPPPGIPTASSWAITPIAAEPTTSVGRGYCPRV